MKYGIVLFFAPALFISCSEEEKTTQISNFLTSTLSVAELATNSQEVISIQVEGEIHAPVTVGYKLSEKTARFGLDLKDASGEFQLTPENPKAEVKVEIIGDANLEITESFIITLSYDSREYGLEISITDNDAIEEIQIASDGFITPESYPSMSLAWSDEFNGSQLNEANWVYELGDGCASGNCGWGNKELEKYTNAPENVKVADGKLTITAIQKDKDFTSARIKTQTKVNQQFGRIDVRARLPKGQGIWPAIWMLGENITTAGWPVCGEIDIMELVGHESNKVHGTVHYNNGSGYASSTGHTVLSEGDFSDQFHVFTLVWDKDKLTWYVDNERFKIFTASSGPYPFNGAFFFIMNVAVGGNWPGSPDATTVFPQQMEVDYIRVFK